MIFFVKNQKKDINAILEYKNGKFILKKGSKISNNVSTAFRAYKKTLKRRNEVGLVKNRILQRDYEFNSPSTAGEFVYGTSFNGRVRWKDKTGKRINEILKGDDNNG